MTRGVGIDGGDAGREGCAVEILAELEVVPVTRNLVLDAIRTETQHQLSHWDALIIEASSRAGAELLFTEDMAAGSTLRGVTVTNPFVPS